jgi:hypothetical protein
MTSDTVACVVHYNQAGNASFNSAPEVTETTTPTIVVVTDPPTVISIARTSANPTNGAANVTWSVNFTTVESVAGVDASDFSLVATGVTEHQLPA